MNNILKIDRLMIDSNRCSIVRDAESFSVEPKVMDVLIYLIQHRGQVCSQEAIFFAVWPKGVYSQSSVQRCVALARKAIGDSAQNPTYILTHQRRGYSFECKNIVEICATSKSKKTSRLKRNVFSVNFYYLILFAAILIGFLTLQWLLLAEQTTIQTTYKSHPMTSSTEAEFYGVYSPDGNWIAYIKDWHIGLVDLEPVPEKIEVESIVQEEADSQHKIDSTIWLIDRSSNQHQLLVASSEEILTLSWSPDSSAVYFSVHDSDNYHIDTKDIEPRAKSRRVLSSTYPKQIWRPIVLKQSGDSQKSDAIYFIESSLPLNQKSKTELKVFNEKTGESQSLLASSAEFTPYRLAHCLNQDAPFDFLAVAGEAKNSTVSIRLFDLKRLQLGTELASFALGFTELRCDSKNKRLLVAHNNNLYWLRFDGSQTKIEWDNFYTIYNPDIAPNSDELLVSLALEDVDLGIYSVAEQKIKQRFDNKVNDSVARISKDGILAVNSTRRGVMQTFLQSSRGQLLYDNPQSLPLNSPPIWSIDGEKLLIHQNSMLHVYSKDGQKIETLAIMPEVIRVHDWLGLEKTKQRVLVSARLGHEDWFGILHLESQYFEKMLLTGTNAWARLMPNGDVMAVQDSRVVSVNSKREKNVLLELNTDLHRPIPTNDGFLIQVDNQVLQYSSQDRRVSIVATVPENFELLIDANHSGELLVFATAIRVDMELIQLKPASSELSD
jgi:DNA-binding winged helix-turn-helix (wHTH) protein